MSGIPVVPDGAASPPLPAALTASTSFGQAGSSSLLSAEAQAALDGYKVKDASKGAVAHTV